MSTTRPPVAGSFEARIHLRAAQARVTPPDAKRLQEAIASKLLVAFPEFSATVRVERVDR